MYKVVLVDDEQIVIEGIKFMLEDQFDDMEVVAMANSGREAIEVCQQVVPDIVFMDIKMPGINGIEAITAIKSRHQKAKFIIVSAYEQFDYAKQAVELGVSHYILKPVSQDKLTKVVKKVQEEIDQERFSKQQEMANKEKLEKIIPVLEHGFIYALMLNADYREELYKYQELFEIHKDRAYVMVLEFGDEGNQETLENKIGSGLKGQNLYPKVQSAIKYKCKSIVGPMMINRITTVVFASEGLSEYEQRLSAISLADQIKNAIEAIVDATIYIGIGGTYPFEKIRHSFEEAVYVLNRMTDERVLHINDITKNNLSNEEYSYLDIKEDEMHIVNLVESSKSEAIEEALKQFFIHVERKFGHSLVDMQNTVTELMVMILSSSYQHQIIDSEAGYDTYLQEIRTFDQILMLQNWCVQKVLNISTLIQDTRELHVSTLVVEAKAYIDEHYNEELSLPDVSKQVSVSPQYFSKIFKEELGMSFVEYVRMKRMDVAKDLLRQKQFSIKEICYQIGYNDPNYFSRLFKKLVGVSPSDYQG